jgi:hypothetical protein
MKQGKMLLTIAAVVVLGIIIQVILIGAETTSTPSKTVIKFTEEDADAAAEYINRMADEAKTLGFSLNYMRTTLFSVHTDIISKSETEAQVRIRALRKRNLNPVYTIVAQLFFIGETYEVDEILNLVKEDGQWKVCGQAFSLTI